MNPYRYAGYLWDEETGLYFLKTRYYEPALGRFISRDTILGVPKNPQTLNIMTRVKVDVRGEQLRPRQPMELSRVP